jgi:hypothetical protein
LLSMYLILALAASGALADSRSGAVRGQVWSETLKAPLAYASVEVQTPDGRVHGTFTDGGGAYLLTGIPSGRQLLRAQHLDHALLEVEVVVPEGDTLSLDFSLRLQPVTLRAITARGRATAREDTASATARDLGTTAVRALEATPGVAEMGLAEAGRIAPGEPIDPSDVLFVRGASADLKLVLLDGAPVYAPFHLAGLVQPFDSRLLRSANLYLGGAPVRYDGGLSYVLDLETRTGRRDQLRVAGGADVMSARAQVEGPLGPAGFLLSGRAVHGLGVAELLPGDFPYAYADGLTRIQVPAGDGVIGFTGFWNREAVSLPGIPAPHEKASWGNRAFSLRYRGPFGDTPAELGIAGSEFGARLPIGRESTRVAEGTARRLRVLTSFHTDPDSRIDLSYGASLDVLEFGYDLTPVGGEDQRPVYRSQSGASVVGAYIETVLHPLPRVRLRGGLRSDLFSLEPRPLLAPRIAVTWLVTDRAVVTVAGGRYRQYVRESEAALAGGPGWPLAEGTIVEAAPLVISQASHFVMGLDQDLGEGLRAGVEGFYKRYYNVPSEPREGDRAQRAAAEASGLDFWVRRGEGKVTGWLGYSLAWIWSVPDAASSYFSGRHLASAGIMGPIGSSGLFSFRLGYGAGLPYTAVPDQAPVISAGGATPQSLPLPAFSLDPEEEAFQQAGVPDHPYLRLDAEISRTWRFRNSSLELTPYIKLLNALNRRDALFYHFESGNRELRALGALPVMPVVGMEWRF